MAISSHKWLNYRDGDDLVQHVTISLKHSLIGAELNVPTIDANEYLDVRFYILF